MAGDDATGASSDRDPAVRDDDRRNVHSEDLIVFDTADDRLRSLGEAIEDQAFADDDFEDVAIERSSVAISARWSLVGLVVKQVSRIAFSVLLARLLGPTNFGIIGQATIYLAFISVFLDIGLASALIQRKRLDREVVGTATALNGMAVIGLVLLTQVFAGGWAVLFHTPELENLLRVLSFDFVLVGLAVVPTALLTRRLDFRLLATGEVVSTIVGGVLGVAAAFLGAQYWALVIQTMVADLIYMAMVVKACGKPFIAWTRRALREIVGFSARVFGSQIMRFLSGNSDNTLVGWRLGPEALANYGLSYRVLLFPIQVLSQTANRLVFPIFSRLNDEPQKQARNFLTVTTSLSLTVTPLMLLVALGAPRAVPMIFGPEWEPAVRPMQILAIVSIISAVASTSGGVMLARGRADWALRWSIVTTVCLIGGFVVGLRWGINGVAWSYLIVGAPLAVIEIWFMRFLIPFGFRGYVRAVAPATVGGLAMVGAWTIVASLLSPHANDFVVLVCAVLIASACFALVLRLVWPSVTRDQLSFVRMMAKRRLASS